MNKISVCENLVKIANELDLNGETEIADEITKVAVSLGENVKEAQLVNMFGLGRRRRQAPVSPIFAKYKLPGDYSYKRGGPVDNMLKKINSFANNPQATQLVEPMYAQYVNLINQAFQVAQQIANFNPVQPTAQQVQPAPAQPATPQNPTVSTTPQAQPPRA